MTRRHLLGGVILLLGIAPAPTLSQIPAAKKQPHPCAENKAKMLSGVREAIAAQTANQADYDVAFYDIDISIDPVGRTVSGTVAMTAEVLSTTLTYCDINLLDNMTVTQVSNTSGALSFTHSGDILSVTLDRAYSQGESFSVTVQYGGTPNPTGFGSFEFDTMDGYDVIWSLSEPFGARSWWPCKDVPSDKADSVDVHATVPAGLIVASNGTLESITNNGATDTYWWQERYPIATYLVSVAIHPYVTFSDWYRYSPTDSMEVQNYAFASHYEFVKDYYAQAVPMIETFAALFGQYPFVHEKYGHAEIKRGGGMEHQTITSLFGANEYLVVHELAHQWWGDYITCEDFHHIWMNEGFATYCEALWMEARYGEARYQTHMAENRYFGGGTIYVPNTTDVARIFDGNLSYNKGSWVLHMLRHVVGNATFFSILQAYYNDADRRYGTATTEQFRDICESVSGLDLDRFFHQWIYEEYFPEYALQWSAAPVGGSWDVTVTIDQLQTNYIFQMPIDVEVHSSAGDATTVVVWDSLATQAFAINVPYEPAYVVLDPGQWILHKETVVDPRLDHGILVVNDVDFDAFGGPMTTAYEDSAFWGSHPITFWDCFQETALGYPSNLPAPIGHGAVPASVLGMYSAVVWLGNDYNNDATHWLDTDIPGYLDTGGNVLLLTRRGDYFLDESLSAYLGITWRQTDATIRSCLSTYPGLDDMSLLGTQSYCAFFDTTLASGESRLLFIDTTSYPASAHGVGVWRKPVGGAGVREDGGQMVFISGRPYRYDHDNLRGNLEFILSDFFGEPYSGPVAAKEAPAGPPFALGQNVPNPFNPHTTIRFAIPETRAVTLRIYDVAGRLVTTLAERRYPAGTHVLTWDGTDRRGSAVASGVYFYKIIAGRDAATRKMVLLR
jgi:aminopeptidase N